MKKAEFKYTVIVLILSIAFSMINFNEYLKGSMPNIYNVVCSTTFIIIWFLFAFFASRHNIVCFLRFCTIYWGIGIILIIISKLADLFIIFALTAIIFAGPTYGLRYFIRIRSDIKLVIICIIITYLFTVAGYLLGKITRRTIG